MSDWVGFTDADLRRMKSDGNRSAGAKVAKPLTGGAKAKQGSILGQKVQKRQSSKTTRVQKEHGDVPSEAMLSQAANEESSKKNLPSKVTSPTDNTPLHGKTCTPPIESTDKSANDTVESEEPEILEDAEVIKEKEKIKLEDIQQRQKQMEEKNKRKKTMLTKAIAERKKRAFAESTKLVKIQAELTKLDGMLNYDVSLLRDRIDEACVDYNHAQKRFDKAEAEYISAKMNLHKATQMKEELTEHLFHLIQLNEERKANKLEELMQKLELDESEEIAVEAESSQTDSKVLTESTADNNKDVEVEPSDSSPDSTQCPTVNETNDNIEVKPKEADEIK